MRRKATFFLYQPIQLLWNQTLHWLSGLLFFALSSFLCIMYHYFAVLAYLPHPMTRLTSNFQRFLSLFFLPLYVSYWHWYLETKSWWVFGVHMRFPRLHFLISLKFSLILYIFFFCPERTHWPRPLSQAIGNMSKCMQKSGELLLLEE